MGTWHGYNIVDGVAAVFLLAGFIGGIRRGLSGELARAVSLVASVLAATTYARPLAERFCGTCNLDARLAVLLAFAAILAGVYVLIQTVRMLLGRLMEFHFRGPVERLGGGLAGMARAGAVVAVILLVLSLAPDDNLRRLVAEESVAGRLATRHLRPVYDTLAERVPEIRLPEPDVLPPTTQAVSWAELPAVEADPPAPEEPGPVDPVPVDPWK